MLMGPRGRASEVKHRPEELFPLPAGHRGRWPCSDAQVLGALPALPFAHLRLLGSHQ